MHNIFRHVLTQTDRQTKESKITFAFYTLFALPPLIFGKYFQCTKKRILVVYYINKACFVCNTCFILSTCLLVQNLFKIMFWFAFIRIGSRVRKYLCVIHIYVCVYEWVSSSLLINWFLFLFIELYLFKLFWSII